MTSSSWRLRARALPSPRPDDAWLEARPAVSGTPPEVHLVGRAPTESLVRAMLVEGGRVPSDDQGNEAELAADAIQAY